MNDPQLPGAGDLLGPDVVAVLQPAVAGAGGTVVSARPTQVRYDPTRRLVVRYAAEVQWQHAARRTETLGALLTAGELPPDVAVTRNDRGTPVGVWRYPHDPFLPGLPHAAYAPALRRSLAALGIPDAVLGVEPLVYRPGLRAVLRIRTAQRVLFLKVVPPGEAGAIRTLHVAFAAHTPVARCLGWSAPLGHVLLAGRPGVPLTRPLTGGGSVPTPTVVAQLLLAIRGVTLPAGTPVVSGRADWYAGVLKTAVPEAGSRIDALAAAAGSRGSAADTPVHGDLYHAQILVDGETISGLLDVDGAGFGDEVHDPATFVAHLVALAHVRPAARQRLTSYRHELVDLLRSDIDPQRLAATVTGVLLGLATTPFRRQEVDWRRRTMGWLDLAEGWPSAGR